MSIQSAKDFVEKASKDEKFLKNCNALENSEQKDAFLRENGFDFTEEELKEISSDLSVDDLDDVIGGVGYAQYIPLMGSKMKY